MENIFVEADKKLQSGFKLFESDVRRLSQLSLEQVQKSASETLYQEYVLKFASGTVAKTQNIEGVFVEDNLGMNQIVMLSIFTSNQSPTEYSKDFKIKKPLILKLSMTSHLKTTVRLMQSSIRLEDFPEIGSWLPPH